MKLKIDHCEGNCEDFVNAYMTRKNARRADCCFLLMFVEKEGRYFEDYDFHERNKYPNVLKKDTVLYEFREAFKSEKMDVPSHAYEDDGDCYGILVRVKRGTKLEKMCRELGFAEC